MIVLEKELKKGETEIVTKSVSKEMAETMLKQTAKLKAKKLLGWKLPDNSDYTFKDNILILKAKSAPKVEDKK